MNDQTSYPAIDKLTWVCLQNRKVLFVRSKGKDTFYTPGEKREAGESDICPRKLYQPQNQTNILSIGTLYQGG